MKKIKDMDMLAKQPSKSIGPKTPKAEILEEYGHALELLVGLATENRELREEIKRRDNATKHFRELEGPIIYTAAAAYEDWKAEGFPEISYGISGKAADKILSNAFNRTGEEFWATIYCERAASAIKLIKRGLEYAEMMRRKEEEEKAKKGGN